MVTYKGGGGPFKLTVENQGGHGAIEVCFDDVLCIHRIAVAQGQCKAGVGSCTAYALNLSKNTAADGFKVVWMQGMLALTSPISLPLLNSFAHNLFNPHQRPPMLRYLLAIPLIGITLLLAACSDGPSSSGGVTLYS